MRVCVLTVPPYSHVRREKKRSLVALAVLHKCFALFPPAVAHRLAHREVHGLPWELLELPALQEGAQSPGIHGGSCLLAARQPFAGPCSGTLLLHVH